MPYLLPPVVYSLKTLLNIILSVVKLKDNTKIGTKTLSTANVQIDAIYNILRLNKQINSDIDKAKYKAEVEILKKRIVPSHYDIAGYVEQIKGF